MLWRRRIKCAQSLAFFRRDAFSVGWVEVTAGNLPANAPPIMLPRQRRHAGILAGFADKISGISRQNVKRLINEGSKIFIGHASSLYRANQIVFCPIKGFFLSDKKSIYLWLCGSLPFRSNNMTHKLNGETARLRDGKKPLFAYRSTSINQKVSR